MSRRDWLRLVSAITLQLAAWALLASAVVGVLSAHQDNRERYAQYQENAQAREQQTSQNIAEKCNVITPPFNSLRECLASEIEAQIGQDDTNQDLQAQQDMAFWAAALFWLSVMTAVISAVGVILVFQSLRQTRTAVKDTREIGEAQVRAYIGIENSRERPFSLDKLKAGEPVVVSFRYNNNGSSPARRVTYVAFCEVRDHPFSSNKSVLVAPAPNQVISPNTVQGGDGGYCEAFTDGPLSETDIKDITKSTKKRLYMMCRIEYDDVFDNRRYTHGCFYLEFSQKTDARNQRIIEAQWFVAPSHNDAD